MGIICSSFRSSYRPVVLFVLGRGNLKKMFLRDEYTRSNIDINLSREFRRNLIDTERRKNIYIYIFLCVSYIFTLTKLKKLIWERFSRLQEEDKNVRYGIYNSFLYLFREIRYSIFETVRNKQVTNSLSVLREMRGTR